LSSQLSVAQILASLEQQMAFHKEQEDHHASREAFHREQRAVHAAQHETVAKHYEAFKATAGSAAEIAAQSATAVPPPQEEEPAPVAGAVQGLEPHKLVARLVAELPDGEVYTSSQVAAEVNRRYASELKKPLRGPTASTCLRRLLAGGKVRLVQKGTAHIQAVYTRS
jgi:hypothetical protein